MITAKVSGQSYDFRHYQVEQGLSYNSVFAILQDSKGFMWFATKDGLNRFDGYKFKIFRLRDKLDSVPRLNLQGPLQNNLACHHQSIYKIHKLKQRIKNNNSF